MAAIGLTTVSPEADINLKADAPTIQKYVQQQNGTWGTETDVNIGDTVNFSLRSTVPNTFGYSSYTFTIHDQMSAGLTFDPDNVKVYMGPVTVSTPPSTADQMVLEDDAYLVNSDDYELVTDGLDDGCTFEIRFDPVKFLQYTAGDTILVTYSAVLNENAAVADLTADPGTILMNGYPNNPNSTWLDYSTNPYDTSEKASTPKHTVIVYTYMVEVRKVDGKTGEPLSGATFALFKNETDANAAIDNPTTLENALTFSTKTVTNDAAAIKDPGKDVTVCTPSAGGDAVVSVSKDGLLQFYGLDDGTYYLVEIAAPAGYNKLTAATPVVIKGLVSDVAPVGGIEPAMMKIGSAPDVVVENNSGTKLPETGGIGRTIFYIGGSFLVMFAGLALTIRRKIEARNYIR
ncbi:MAG: SpaH/EbpB family LPXTG-anchored major pilin [Oscillospiraceae bacterium]|nr:SpaH/EbpB family LPXTG-anchored major pilin [Oscillospiraceae bacterium]